MDGKSLDALERLGRLRDAGALSEEEFQAQKQAILGGHDEATGGGSPARPPFDQEAGTAQDFARATVETPTGRDTGVPVWARKKRGLSPLGIAALLALIFLTALGASFWFMNRPNNETYSFMATGPANVRESATSKEGRVVAQLAEGEFITGRVKRSGDEQWVEITEGHLQGRFVWAGNLATEGPDDVLADVPVPGRSNILGWLNSPSIEPGEYSTEADQEVILAACNRVNGYTILANGRGENAIYDALLASAGTTFENMSRIASQVDSGSFGLSASRTGDRCIATLTAGAVVARCEITAIRVEGGKVALHDCVSLTGPSASNSRQAGVSEDGLAASRAVREEADRDVQAAALVAEKEARRSGG